MKILVRGTNWIGDSVMSIPALRELRRIFPEANISLHIRSWAEGLFQDASFIDEIIPFDPQRWKIKDVLDNSDFLKEDGFELAVLMPNSFESALTTFLTRIPRRIGYNKDLRGLLLTDPVPVPEWKNRRHEVYYYLNLVAEVEHRVLGRRSVGQGAPDVTIEVSPQRREVANAFLASFGLEPARPLIALAAGSANSPEKRWPEANFGKLADAITAEADPQVILVGSASEREISAAVAAGVSAPVTDLTGKTSLNEAVALLSAADLVVSNDSGLAHVSASLGTPTVVIFGPTDPTTTRPFSQKAVVVQGDPWPSVEEVLAAARVSLTDDHGTAEETGDLP